ncbi:MAG: hypothetical protein II920_02235, partial [Clostridia bacterium]|nr:hypothetical protein [Clostridia bacterium]
MNRQEMTEALLKAKRTLSLAEVSQRTNLSRENAKKILGECIAEGLLVSPRDGKYCHPQIMKLTLCRARASQNAPT